MNRCVVCLLFALSLAQPARAAKRAPEETLRIARDHLKRAKTAFNLAQYDTAIREWRYAYKLKQDPRLLFNLGQAYRLSGSYEDARRAYENYLHERPDSPNKEEVRRFINDMARKQAAADPPKSK